MTESQIETELIDKLVRLKYVHRPEIRDRASLETNFRAKFEELNRVHLSDSEFARLMDQLVTADVFAASRHLRERSRFERDDGTPLFYTLVKIKDRWMTTKRCSKTSSLASCSAMRSHCLTWNRQARRPRWLRWL